MGKKKKKNKEKAFNPDDFYWIETPSDNEEKGINKKIVSGIEPDPNPFISRVRVVDGRFHRAVGSPEEVAKSFWNSKAVPDGNGGYKKK